MGSKLFVAFLLCAFIAIALCVEAPKTEAGNQDVKKVGISQKVAKNDYKSTHQEEHKAPEHKGYNEDEDEEDDDDNHYGEKPQSEPEHKSYAANPKPEHKPQPKPEHKSYAPNPKPEHKPQPEPEHKSYAPNPKPEHKPQPKPEHKVYVKPHQQAHPKPHPVVIQRPVYEEEQDQGYGEETGYGEEAQEGYGEDRSYGEEEQTGYGEEAQEGYGEQGYGHQGYVQEHRPKKISVKIASQKLFRVCTYSNSTCEGDPCCFFVENGKCFSFPNGDSLIVNLVGKRGNALYYNENPTCNKRGDTSKGPIIYLDLEEETSCFVYESTGVGLKILPLFYSR